MATPTLTDQTTANARMRVQWTDATKPANFYSWRVYHREATSSDWSKVYETFVDSAAYDIFSYAWANVVPQEYVVVGVSQNPADGVRTETPVGPAYTGGAPFTPAGGDNDYYLVHPDTPALTVQLRMVVAAPHAQTTAHQSQRLIGRGNKVNRGDDSQVRSGSLSFQLFDDPVGKTAREQRFDIEAAHVEGVQYFLRTAFGDMWPVFIEKVDFDPISTAGRAEAANGGLAWVEVS